MADASRSILAQLVAPHSAEEFLTRYWPDRWFIAHGDPARLPSFLRSAEFSSIETLSAKYRGSLRFTSGRKYQKMQTARDTDAVVLYRMGLTVQFDDVAPYVAPCTEELRTLECELGVNPGCAQASAFASPLSEGLSVHFDAQDIFSIQLRGNKRYHVAKVEELPYPCGTQFVPGTAAFDDLYPQAPDGFPDPNRAAFTRVDMKPGSVLFMPRGTWHYTEAEGDSLSVSIGLYALSAADYVIDQLRLLLLQDSQWRRPLYGAWGNDRARDAATAQLARLLGDLPAVARQLNAGHLMTHILPPEGRLAAIKPKTRFQKTPNSRIDVEAPSFLVITLWDPNYGAQVTARAQILPQAIAVFRWIAERTTSFSADEVASRFPQLRFSEIQSLLSAATEHGLVKVHWFQTLLREQAKPSG